MARDGSGGAGISLGDGGYYRLHDLDGQITIYWPLNLKCVCWLDESHLSRDIDQIRKFALWLNLYYAVLLSSILTGFVWYLTLQPIRQSIPPMSFADSRASLCVNTKSRGLFYGDDR